MEGIFKHSINGEILRAVSWARLNHFQVNVEYPKIKTKTNSATVREQLRHPYRKIHPWKSRTEFIHSIINKYLLYNKDGLVAINKPYGISARIDPNLTKRSITPSGIPNEVDYVITDALPELAKELNYNSLTIVRCPEKFTSGVILLSADKKITQAVDKSLKRAEAMRIIPRTYWTVTRRIPISEEGEKRLAMKLSPSSDKIKFQPIILSKWSENEWKRQNVKILNVQYRILCNSTLNVASLVEIKASTSQFHAVRLFAATILLSPILGDRIYGSRAQDVMGKFLTISPFVEAAHVPPRVDTTLLRLLRLTQGKSIMIPAHIHLREMFLPYFIRKGNDIAIIAPLQPEFSWTYDQLRFKEEIYKPIENKNSTSSKVKTDSNEESSNTKQCTEVT